MFILSKFLSWNDIRALKGIDVRLVDIESYKPERSYPEENKSNRKPLENRQMEHIVYKSRCKLWFYENPNRNFRQNCGVKPNHNVSTYKADHGSDIMSNNKLSRIINELEICYRVICQQV
jgi:hypothetical protein